MDEDPSGNSQAGIREEVRMSKIMDWIMSQPEEEQERILAQKYGIENMDYESTEEEATDEERH